MRNEMIKRKNFFFFDRVCLAFYIDFNKKNVLIFILYKMSNLWKKKQSKNLATRKQKITFKNSFRKIKKNIEKKIKTDSKSNEKTS
jgi:hypothetical protein